MWYEGGARSNANGMGLARLIWQERSTNDGQTAKHHVTVILAHSVNLLLGLNVNNHLIRGKLHDACVFVGGLF
jgi:hypothetical protein